MCLPIFSFWCIKCEYLHFDILHHVFPKEFFQNQSLVEGAINFKKIQFKFNNMNYPLLTEIRTVVTIGILTEGVYGKVELSTWYLCIWYVFFDML